MKTEKLIAERALQIARLLPFFLLIVLLILVALPREQSFVVNVMTNGLTLQNNDRASFDWPMNNVVVCEKTSKQEKSTSSSASKYCDERRYEEHDFNAANLRFLAGSKLQIRFLSSTKELSIFSTNGAEVPAFQVNEVSFPEKSPVIITNPIENAIGSMPFTGELVVGDLPGSGEVGLVQSGSFEIRSKPLLSARSVSVASGKLFHGDKLEIVRSDDLSSVISTGHIFFDRDGVIGLQFVTEPSRGMLKLDRLGAEPSFITANWIDRLLNDPRIMFLSVFLAIISGSLSLARKSVGSFLWRTNKKTSL